MSVRKLLILGAAGLATLGMSTAFAGGVVDVAPPPSHSGIYVEGQLGYGFTNWQDNHTAVIFTKNDRGGFTAGVDAGYQYNQYLAAELGWFYLPTADGVFGITGFKMKSWLLYTAMKLMAPIMHNLDIFFKAGIAYRHTTGISGGISGSSTNGAVRPLFGAGIEYFWRNAWMLNLQYIYTTSINNIRAPAAHLLTVSIGYFFAM